MCQIFVFSLECLHGLKKGRKDCPQGYQAQTDKQDIVARVRAMIHFRIPSRTQTRHTSDNDPHTLVKCFHTRSRCRPGLRPPSFPVLPVSRRSSPFESLGDKMIEAIGFCPRFVSVPIGMLPEKDF